MPVTLKSPLTSLRGWLWLLVLCLALGPTPVADPTFSQTTRPTNVQQGGTSNGTPTLGVPFPPSASFDGPQKPPPLAYSPRVSLVCWDSCETAVRVPRTTAREGPSYPRASFIKFIHSSIPRLVRRAVERLALPPNELSVGLLTLRAGNRIAVPSYVWAVDRPSPMLPTRTLGQFVPTRIVDTSIPSAPIPSREWREGSSQHSTCDRMSRVLWVVLLASSAALVWGLFVARGACPVRVPISPNADPLAVTEPPSSPPGAFDWALACQGIASSFPLEFLELIDVVDMQVQLGVHLTIPGRRRQLISYRSSSFERYRADFNIEDLMGWALAEAQSAVDKWYQEAYQLGATMEVCVQATTEALVVECDGDEQVYVSGVDSKQYSFCICVDIPSNTPIAPVVPFEPVRPLAFKKCGKNVPMSPVAAFEPVRPLAFKKREKNVQGH